MCLVCLLAIAAPASAAWHRIDTPNFIVVGDVSARELRATATKFEGFHEALRRVLPSSTTSAPGADRGDRVSERRGVHAVQAAIPGKATRGGSRLRVGRTAT